MPQLNIIVPKIETKEVFAHLSAFLSLTGTFKKIEVSYTASDENLLNGDKGNEMWVSLTLNTRASFFYMSYLLHSTCYLLSCCCTCTISGSVAFNKETLKISRTSLFGLHWFLAVGWSDELLNVFSSTCSSGFLQIVKYMQFVVFSPSLILLKAVKYMKLEHYLLKWSLFGWVVLIISECSPVQWRRRICIRTCCSGPWRTWPVTFQLQGFQNRLWRFERRFVYLQRAATGKLLHVWKSDSFIHLSYTGNRWEVPPPDAAQRRADRPVHPTRPRPQNLRASRQSAAEDPLPGMRRRLKWQSARRWL